MLSEEARGKEQRMPRSSLDKKKVIFHVGYPVRLINHAWTTTIHSHLHIFRYTVTVTLVSCPFIFRAVWPYFKAYIQNDMSQPLLMRCVGWLLYGKQLKAAPLLCFHLLLFTLSQHIHVFKVPVSAQTDEVCVSSEKTGSLESNEVFSQHCHSKIMCCSNELMQVCVITAFHFPCLWPQSWQVCVHPWKTAITSWNGNKMPNEEISRKGNKN